MDKGASSAIQAQDLTEGIHEDAKLNIGVGDKSTGHGTSVFSKDGAIGGAFNREFLSLPMKTRCSGLEVFDLTLYPLLQLMEQLVELPKRWEVLSTSREVLGSNSLPRARLVEWLRRWLRRMNSIEGLAMKSVQ